MENLRTFYSKMERGTKMKFCIEVADALDISVDAVIKWCQGRGKTKSEEALKVLSELSGIPVEMIFAK
jgi:hypothetical protein